MKESEQLNIPLNNEVNYIIKSGGKDINVILMKKKLEDTFNKYLMLICKKKELNNSKDLKLYRNNKSVYNIDLQKKERNIIQTKSNNEIITFVQLFCDDEIYSREKFIDSKDLEEYKRHINILNKEENKINHKKLLYLKIFIIFLFAFVAVLGFFTWKYVNRNKEDIEEEDDTVLNYLIKITNMKYKNEKKITIKFYLFLVKI